MVKKGGGKIQREEAWVEIPGSSNLSKNDGSVIRWIKLRIMQFLKKVVTMMMK